MPPRPAQGQSYVHPTAAHARKKAPTPYAIEPISAFYIFLVANLLSALFSPIQDCDETYNYWEPTHYLSHGYGRQTWEYSPDYSIRSWLYVGLHAVVGNLRRLLPWSTKMAEFYFIRYALAGTCALCQTLLWRTISATLHPRMGIIFLVITVLSPGNFHASTAYLPSSFAMYTCMLGVAAFMNWRGGIKTSQGMYWFAAGGVFGWPFASALCAPYLFEEAVLTTLSNFQTLFETFVRIARGVIAAALMVGFDTAVNTFFYKKMTVVPWNIVKYNLFSSTGGPNLYGTEPWTFYLRNLALNFNIWFVLALLAAPLFLAQKVLGTSRQGFVSGLRTFIFISPFYMWLLVFSLQPHKEERFMYPAYPMLALNAAISSHTLLVFVGNSNPATLVGRIPGRLKFFLVGLVLLLSAELGLSRMYGLYSAYSAPMKIYTPLWDEAYGGQGLAAASPGANLCLGKEWYRFPSSYFLPRGVHAKFVRSEFRGLLPGEFAEARRGFGFWSGTWLPTSGLNDRNEEDPGKYVDLGSCRFLVDTQYPSSRRGGRRLPAGEPDYVADAEGWEEVACVPFLDAAGTHPLARAVWVPEASFVPEKYRRSWGRHCLLRRRRVE